MSLRKKIILTNILTIVIPIALIVVIWTAYIYFGDAVHLRQIDRADSRSDFLAEAMNILYTFEAELTDMNWDAAALSGENGTDIMVAPEKERIEELKSLGYHIQVENADSISFSNMDDGDRELLEEAGFCPEKRADSEDRAVSEAGTVSETGALSKGVLFWSGDSLIIRDSFRVSGQNYYLTGIYDRNRADQGMAESLLPVYMVSPSVLAILLVIAVLCIIAVSVIAARWISNSILVPLEQLKKGADMIAGGDLDYALTYSGQDEFGDVCSEFNYMRLQLKEARDEQKRHEEESRELLRGISHDLRSPLTSIKGYAHGLQDGIADTEEKRQRYYDAILRRADDLERLTRSLSHLVKLEDDKSMLQLTKVCFDEYIRQFLLEKESWITEQKIHVDYHTEDINAEVLIDIYEMQRVFLNLFENTVRYRLKDSSRVDLSVVRRGQEIEIRFTDDGPGVASRHLKHLFESFYRVDESRTSPEKGSGLGLAVVKKIIEGENGRVCAVSDQGLSIVMVLPRAEEAEYEKNTDC